MNTVEKIKFAPSVVRQDFGILDQTIHRNRPLVYLDNGASTQRPKSVIQAMVDCYERTYANVHRGIHWLSEQSSAQYENARIKVAQFIGASNPYEVIFVSGTTTGINLVAHSWGSFLNEGDEILLSIMEHHSNIVPWQQLAERVGANVRFANITDDGQLDLADFRNKLNEKTKIVSVAAVSNVLGTINPIHEISNWVHAANDDAVLVVDAAQHVPHEPTEIENWNADFIVFSAHKMLGPSGIGILWGRERLLEKMPPFMGGGSMISRVTVDGYTPGELPAKFEAGTPPIVQAIGLGAAIDYLNQFDLADISRYERNLASQTHDLIGGIEGLRILGPAPEAKAGIVSFVIEGLSTQDISIFLDRQGVAIRAGHHCAMPLHDYLGIRNSCRASYYLYNLESEVELFANALKSVVAKLR